MTNYFLRNGVSFIKLSNPPVNGLSLAVRDGIMRGLDQARADKTRGVVFFGHGKNFCAGGDITEFAKHKHAASPSLNDVIASLDSLESPTVAYINGYALGGGFELALSCGWRVASPTALVGLPEVNIGVCPRAGGTQRLPRLIGLEKALNVLVDGKTIDATTAVKLGIIDQTSTRPWAFNSPEDLMEDATSFILSDRVQNTPLSQRRLSNVSVPGNTSKQFLDELESKILSKSGGHIAPKKIFQAVRAAATMPFEQGKKVEMDIFTELSKGFQAKSLQYQFFAERKVSLPPAGVDEKVIPSVEAVSVIGGGTMGTGIVMSLINAGIHVVWLEASEAALQAALARVGSTYRASSAYKSGAMSEADIVKRCQLITATTDMKLLQHSDMVIEAVYEDLQVKKDIFAQLDKICKPTAILATNTSTMDIDKIASATSRPSNVIGTHFFSPANVMKLLEVVKGRDSSPAVVAACVKLSKRIKKISVISGNCFGFIGNRMLTNYGNECIFLVEEGATPSQIDRVLREEVGFAMGYFEMSDLAGNDISWNIRKSSDILNDPNRRYATLADKVCEQGWFGQKTKKGWYSYDPAQPRKPVESAETLELISKYRADNNIVAREISDKEIIERCMYSMVNEGFKILEENIAENPEDIDVVYTNGYGFPRYKGGPMFWAEHQQGLGNVYSALKSLSEKHPTQPYFSPSPLLIAVVESGASLKEEIYFRKNKK